MTDHLEHGWIHVQCYPCWFKDYGLDREPARFQHGVMPLTCCFCGQPTGNRRRRRVKPGSPIISFCPDSAE